MTPEEIQALKDEAVAAERTRIRSITELCTLAGRADLVPKLIVPGVTVEQAKESLLSLRASADAVEIDNQHQPAEIGVAALTKAKGQGADPDFVPTPLNSTEVYKRLNSVPSTRAA